MTWQQMHLPDWGEIWPAIQLQSNIHSPREQSLCSLITGHSKSFIFLPPSSSGKNNQSFKWNSISQKEMTHSDVMYTPLQLGSKSTQRWKMGSQSPAGIHKIWAWVVLPFPSPPQQLLCKIKPTPTWCGWSEVTLADPGLYSEESRETATCSKIPDSLLAKRVSNPPPSLLSIHVISTALDFCNCGILNQNIISLLKSKLATPAIKITMRTIT